MKSIFPLILFCLPAALLAQIPVTDVANLSHNTVVHAENIAKWVESIAQLKQQISQLDQQISIQGDIRQWAGNPTEAGGKLILNSLGAQVLVRDYGRTRAAILSTVNSLDSLSRTESGNYRAISSIDLDGNAMLRDPLAYRRFAVLDATQANADQASRNIRSREQELQVEIAATLDGIKAAPTEAETQKLSAKLAALNGQLAQIEAARHREVDAVALQKISNDARAEQERQAAVELGAKDDYLANKRVSFYLKTLRVRRDYPNEN